MRTEARPEILFLDEPTLRRRSVGATCEFMAENRGSRGSGVTIIITTHFLDEAEYCDSMVIMMAGKVLAKGTPAEIRMLAPPKKDGEASTLEEAFITVTEKERAKGGSA